jgi:hypothetical protein
MVSVGSKVWRRGLMGEHCGDGDMGEEVIIKKAW